MNKDVVSKDAEVKYEQKVSNDAQYVKDKYEEIKRVQDNKILQDLDVRHKIKLTNLNNQDVINRQIDNKKDDKLIKEYINLLIDSENTI